MRLRCGCGAAAVRLRCGCGGRGWRVSRLGSGVVAEPLQHRPQVVVGVAAERLCPDRCLVRLTCLAPPPWRPLQQRAQCVARTRLRGVEPPRRTQRRLRLRHAPSAERPRARVKQPLLQAT